jgi:transforming growth factor-beta-induced protein
MTTLGSRIYLVALLALLVGLAGCSDDSNPLAPSGDDKGQSRTLDLDGAQAAEGDDIVDTAIGAGVFNTLVAAVQAAELEGALRGEGPFTVFAPTDDAFANLPEGLVEQLLEPRNKEKLQELLLYHVVAGEIYSGDLRWFQFTETLQGDYLWIRKLWRGIVKVNRATVTTADIGASNGVIHVIDTVLIPRGFELEPEVEEPTMDIVDTAIEAGVFNTLVAAAQAAELVDALRGEGPLTVFAPTDEAFAMLPQDLVAALLLPENQGKLQELLLYHVVAGQVLAGDLEYYQMVETLQGSDLRIVKWFGNVWVNWSRVTTADVLATNGVIHVINRVLIPRGFTLDTPNQKYNAEGLDALITSMDREEEVPPTDFPQEYREPVKFNRDRGVITP